MKHPDGSLCQIVKVNSEVFCDHFRTLYGRQPHFDESVLDDLPQPSIFVGCDHLPTDIIDATHKLENKVPGESGILTQVLKSLLDCRETSSMLESIIIKFCVHEVVLDEWNIGTLTVLPKEGDLSLPKNYREIMLLETAYKIIAIIFHARLQPIEESLDHESQCGFRPRRGCTDAIFTIKIALKKTREHGLELWVLFLDLIKAFDGAPREMLWKILAKFGVPNKIINLLKILHANFVVKFTVDDAI